MMDLESFMEMFHPMLISEQHYGGEKLRVTDWEETHENALKIKSEISTIHDDEGSSELNFEECEEIIVEPDIYLIPIYDENIYPFESEFIESANLKQPIYHERYPIFNGMEFQDIDIIQYYTEQYIPIKPLTFSSDFDEYISFVRESSKSHIDDIFSKQLGSYHDLYENTIKKSTKKMKKADLKFDKKNITTNLGTTEYEQIFKDHIEQTSKKSNLKRHIENVHLKLRPHRCSHCDFASSTKNKLHIHINDQHKDVRTQKCSKCNYTGQCETDIVRHMKEDHEGDLQNHKNNIKINLRAYACEQCDYATKYKHILKEHIDNTHLKLRSHQCDRCDYSTSIKANLRRHIDNVHLKLHPYKCDQCNYASHLKKSLMRHINNRHND